MATPSRHGLRLLDGSTFTFAADTRQQAQIALASDMFIKRLWLWIRGTLTISAVTVPGAVHADGPANLVDFLEILIDGDPVKTGRLAHFFRLAQRYDLTGGVNNGLASPAAGVYNFECAVPILFEMPLSIDPFDTILDGRAVRNMVVNLTWGSTADLITGNTSTLALTATTCQVYVEETEPFPLAGARYKFREYDVTFASIITNTATRIGPLPFPKHGLWRAILLKAIDGATLSDAIINTLSLRINGSKFIPFNEIEDDFMQAWAQHYFGSEVNPEGYYHLEFPENGRVLTTSLGAGAGSNGTPEINAVDIIADTTVGAGATSIIAHIAELQPAA